MKGLAVVTQSRAKADGGEENEREVMNNLPYFPAEELGGVEDSEGPENYKKLKGEVNINCDDEQNGVLNATPEQIQEWQKADETLEMCASLQRRNVWRMVQVRQNLLARLAYSIRFGGHRESKRDEHMGVNSWILSDQRANFMATLLQETTSSSILSRSAPLPTTPRWMILWKGSTMLKGMLRKFVD